MSTLNALKKTIQTNRFILLLIYLVAVICLIACKITGYSFSIDIFDKLLKGFVVVMSIFLYLIFFYSFRYSIIIPFVIALLLSPLGYGYLLVYVLQSKEQKLETYTVENYRITEVLEIAWNNSHYYRYYVNKTILFGLLEKRIAERYPGNDKSYDCIINFKIIKYHKPIYRFDKCENTLEKVDSSNTK